MAWSWSYTREGLSNICDQIHAQSREWLEVCFAENEAAFFPVDEETGESDESGEPELDLGKHAVELERAKGLPSDVLADCIWDHAERIATSDNGGFNAYCCPWGCHTVTPDPVESQD